MAIYKNFTGTLKNLFNIGKGSNRIGIRSNAGIAEYQNNGQSWLPFKSGATETTFDNTDLVSNILTISSGLFKIYDNNGDSISIDTTRVSATAFTVNFGGPITGTWTLVIL